MTILTSTPAFPGHGFYSYGSCGNSRVFFLCPLIGQQRWNLVNMREHLNDSEHLSQSVFGKIQRRSACPCAKVDTHQSRNVVKFCVVQFLRLV